MSFFCNEIWQAYIEYCFLWPLLSKSTLKMLIFNDPISKSQCIIYNIKIRTFTIFDPSPLCTFVKIMIILNDPLPSLFLCILVLSVPVDSPAIRVSCNAIPSVCLVVRTDECVTYCTVCSNTKSMSSCICCRATELSSNTTSSK